MCIYYRFEIFISVSQRLQTSRVVIMQVESKRFVSLHCVGHYIVGK